MCGPAFRTAGSPAGVVAGTASRPNTAGRRASNTVHGATKSTSGRGPQVWVLQFLGGGAAGVAQVDAVALNRGSDHQCLRVQVQRDEVDLRLDLQPKSLGRYGRIGTRVADVRADHGEHEPACHWIRRSGLADLLPSLHHTVWVGMSAGSMVMTPRIGDEFGGETAISVADGTVEVVSEGRWELLNPRSRT